MPTAVELLSIPSLNASIRTFTFDDLQIMADVFNEYHRAVGDKTVTSAESLNNLYRNLVNCNPLEDAFILERDGRAIGYGRLEWQDTLENERLYPMFLRIIPQYSTYELEQALLGVLTERANTLRQNNPTEHPQWLQMIANVHPDAKLNAVLADNGFQPARYNYRMVRDLTQPIVAMPLPEGLEVRPATIEQSRQVWEADTEAFRDHWGFREPTESDYQLWINEPDFLPSLWKIAWDGDEIAGMVLNYISHEFNEAYNTKRGYTEGISTRRPWRRQGVAAALLSQSLQMFREMDMTEAALSVDTQNPTGALGVYQRAGFVVSSEIIIYRKAFNSGE